LAEKPQGHHRAALDDLRRHVHGDDPTVYVRVEAADAKPDVATRAVDDDRLRIRIPIDVGAKLLEHAAKGHQHSATAHLRLRGLKGYAIPVDGYLHRVIRKLV
jgi:hypothetical protein